MNPHDWNSISPHFAALESAPLSVATARTWLQNWSDLSALITEAYSRAYRAKMENTADAAAEAVYLNLVEHVVPKLKVAENSLEKRFVALTAYADAETLEFYKRTKASLAIFNENNIALSVEESKYEVLYDKLMGDINIKIRGEELTLYGAIAKFLEPDRSLRQEVYEALMAAWQGIRPQLETMFLELLALRRQIAKNAGFANYREFIWQAKARFDYTPADCLEFHQSIRQQVVPIAAKAFAKRRETMQLETLRPWDTAVDPSGLEPLRPFQDANQLIEQTSKIFSSLSPDFGAMFNTMRQENLDLDSRKGKGPGGYCDFFNQSGQAYIFMNAVGTQDDIQTLFHEGGHAFHALESYQHQKLIWNYHGPMEFCEVASMGMEMLSMPYLEQSKGGMYTTTEAKRAQAEHLFDAAVVFLPYMACVDAFQHWLYVDAIDDVSITTINAKWAELYQQFLPHLDFEGIENGMAFRWQRQSHIFTAPFYYIEYGIAQIGALQVWQNALENEAMAVQKYRAALQLGGTKGLKELFSTAGLTLKFDSSHLASFMKLVEAALE
jgi:oligoendopeptidase F